MTMKLRTETITPEAAAGYLKKNVGNYRRISRSKVNLYAQEMKAGKWQTNGEAIIFDETGRLKNGQHRLAAIMTAGVPVEMTIITGVSDDITIYDSGMQRSIKQIAQASGHEDVTGTETAVATAIVGNFQKVPRGQVLDYIDKHASELSRASRVCGAKTHNLAARTGCVLATYLALRNGAKHYDLDVFFRIFNSGNVIGADGYEPSSALVARRMFEDRYKQKPTNALVLKEQTEIMILAMEDFSKSKTRQLNYQIREPFKYQAIMNTIRKEDGLE